MLFGRHVWALESSGNRTLVILRRRNFQLFVGLKMQHMITSAFCVSEKEALGEDRGEKFIFNKKITCRYFVQHAKTFPLYVPTIKKYWMLLNLENETSVKCTFCSSSTLRIPKHSSRSPTQQQYI